jgi:putative ABC transport system permease protein
MSKQQRLKPPRLAEKLLLFYCDDPLKEEIAGDLEERFLDHVEACGQGKAARKYWLNVIKFCRWHTLKRRKSKRFTQNNTAMFKNYFKIAFRNALKQKAYTFINLSGLAVGLTSFILIMLYVQQQLSYDQFHENKDRIFRVTDGEDAITPNIVGPYVSRNFQDEVDETVRVIIMGSQIFNVQEKAFTANVFHADSGFFNMFSFPFLQGNEGTSLSAPNSMVISRKAALQYFGKEDVINETFEMSGRNYKITGVMQDIPDNSLLQFDFVAPLEDLRWARRETWSNKSYHTFLQLSNQVDPQVFEKKIAAKINETFEIDPNSEDAQVVFLQSFNDIYLQSDMRLSYEIGRTGDIKYVYIFMAVAVLILLIACINYVNLATSRSLERAKEVGVRKVIGAQRRQLVYQFLGESFLFVFGSLMLSVGMSLLLLPYFNELAGVNMDSSYLLNPAFLLFMLGLGVFISLLSGFYPALMLSMFKPVVVLKGSFKNSGSGSRLRKGLVIFQFAISAFLLIATLGVNKQLGFIQSKNLGYDREQVLFFRVNRDLNDNYQTLKNELLSNPGISSVTMSSNTPLNVGSAHGIKVGPTDDDYELIYFIHVDKDFTDLMGMNILAGRDFKERAVPFHELDSSGRVPSIIINETTAGLFNWSAAEAVGKMVTISGMEIPVQAVVQDFHFKSMQQKIEPFVLMSNPDQYFYAMVKLNNENMAESISFIEEKVKAVAPRLPFDYSFLDDRFESMYRFENQLSEVFITFATIAIIIAALGMFGLISFMALNRAKEMGIRKVLGASVSHIVMLLSQDFLRLVALALLLALPVAYYVMSDWLTDYEYRTTLGLDVGLVAVVSALVITLLTIGYQALKTGLVSPTKVLRNE